MLRQTGHCGAVSETGRNGLWFIRFSEATWPCGGTFGWAIIKLVLPVSVGVSLAGERLDGTGPGIGNSGTPRWGFFLFLIGSWPSFCWGQTKGFKGAFQFPQGFSFSRETFRPVCALSIKGGSRAKRPCSALGPLIQKSQIGKTRAPLFTGHQGLFPVNFGRGKPIPFESNPGFSLFYAKPLGWSSSNPLGTGLHILGFPQKRATYCARVGSFNFFRWVSPKGDGNLYYPLGFLFSTKGGPKPGGKNLYGISAGELPRFPETLL